MAKYKLHLFFSIIAVIGVLFLRCGQQGNEQARFEPTDPYTPELLSISQQLLDANRLDEALIVIDSAKVLDPEYPDVHYIRGLIQLKLKERDQARESFLKVLSLDPEHPGAIFQMGNLLFQIGNYQSAIQHYSKLINDVPADNEDYNIINVYYNLGLSYSKVGLSDSARWAFQQVIKRDSTFADAYVLIGQEYRKTGDYERTLEYTEKGLEVEPGNLTFKSIMGSVLFQMGDMEGSLPYLQELVSKRPYHYEGHYQLGRALIATGDTAEGQQHLDRADVLKNIQSDVIQAMYDTQNTPDSLAAWIELGTNLYRMEHFEMAAEVLNVALSLSPNDLGLQSNLASAHLKLGENQEAIELYQDILDKDSSLLDVWYNLGCAYAYSGEIDRARNAWKKTYIAGDTQLGEEAYLDSLTQLFN